jgi:hypothetical protein
VLRTEPLLQHPGLLGFRSSLSIDLIQFTQSGHQDWFTSGEWLASAVRNNVAKASTARTYP